MAERTERWDVTGYGSYDNDPPGFDIAYPNPRHTPATRSGTNPFWGTAYEGLGTYEYPAPFAADNRVIPEGTVIYVPHVQRYFEMVDYCQACRDATDQGLPRRLDLYVGGDLTPTTAKVSAVNNAANSLTRLTDDGSGPVDIIFDPAPGKPVPNTNTISGISSGASKTFGPSRGGVVQPPPPPPPPPPDTQACPGTLRTVPSSGYNWYSNGGSAIAYPTAFNRPNGTNTAFGTGTFSDPHTLAVPSSLLATFPKGSKIYIDRIAHRDGSVTNVRAYGVVEDSASGSAIIIWVGGALPNGTRNGTARSLLDAAEAKMVGTATVIGPAGLTNACPVPYSGQIATNPGI